MSVKTRADEGSGSVGQDVSRDAFLDGRLTLLQPLDGPRAAIDGVFLAAAIPLTGHAAERVLDAGSGTGIVSLALASRFDGLEVVGVERQQALADLARENAALNSLASRVRFVTADLTDKLTSLETLGLVRESFDHVAANPPYYQEGSARPPGTDTKRGAHLAEAGALDRWFRFLVAMARPGGTVTMIHRPDALPELLQAAQGRLGGLSVYPLFSHSGDPAHRIIIQGIKGSRAPLTIAGGMVLHDGTGAYSREADAVLRGQTEVAVGRSRD